MAFRHSPGTKVYCGGGELRLIPPPAEMARACSSCAEPEAGSCLYHTVCRSTEHLSVQRLLVPTLPVIPTVTQVMRLAVLLAASHGTRSAASAAQG
eukprot:3792022-Rhodomonas_salina.1